MTPKNGKAPMIPYLRQSRAKERTISLEEQRRAIQSWAKAQGVKLTAEIVEQGVSGSKSWKERGLGTAIAACEDGRAQGIIVAFQDRLSRENGLATAEVWDALERAQARLVCAAEGLDTATGDHELTFSIKAAIAREQWKRHRANWENARRNAIERGVHIGQVPAGYRRSGTGVLEPNGHADTIHRAFEMRAGGASWSEIAAFLSQSGLETSRGSKTWSLKAAEKVLRNPVYLGQVRSGEFVKDGAHEAIVSRQLWNRVQARKGQVRKRSRGKGEGALLAGMLKCASCGHALTRNFTTRGGRRYEFYTCKNQGVCSARPSIGTTVVEPYVLDWLLERLVFAAEAPPSVDTSALDKALEKAEDRIQELIDSLGAGEVSPATATKMMRALEAKRDEAMGALRAVPAEQDYSDRQPYVSAGATLEEIRAKGYSGQTLRSFYETLPPSLKRKLVAMTLSGKQITVQRGRGHVEERVKIEF